MRTVLTFVFILTVLGCGKGRNQSKPDPGKAVVAEVAEHRITRADLALARGARPADDPRSLIEMIAVDFLVADEALAAIPAAKARAAKARRQAAVRKLLLDQAPVSEQDLQNYYDAHLAEFSQPAMLRYGRVVLANCAEAESFAAKIASKTVDFSTVAIRHSLDRESGSAGGESNWVTVASLAEPTAKALDALDTNGALARPMPMADGRCELLRLLERRSAQTQSMAEVRDLIKLRVTAQSLGEVRQGALAKLGGVDKVTIDDAAVEAVMLSARPLSAELAAREVMRLGETKILGVDMALAAPEDPSLAATGKAQFVTQLAEDLVLFAEAERLEVTASADVKSAVRSELVATMREHIHDQIDVAALAPRVRERYDLATGDYTEPRRIRVSSLVSRDEKKAKAWVETLRKSQYGGSTFEKLLVESEDETARRNGGDMGWIDARSTHVTDSFRDAALMMQQPGAVSGVLQSSGAYHVLLCRDIMAERVRPFEEVESDILAEVLEQERRERYNAYEATVRERLQLSVDDAALAQIP